MVVDKSSISGNALEQFVLLAKNAKGPACVELIKQALDAPGVYVFGELLDMQSVTELQNSPYKNAFDTLTLFAYGTYKDYIANIGQYLELSPAQKKKLQHLTIVTLATKTKCIQYSTLLQELDMKNVRDLEDLIIEAIYADIIHGKLDQKNSLLEIDYAIGRDIRAKDINVIVNCLDEWCKACEGVLSCVETQILRANSEKNQSISRKNEIDQEIVNIKKTLKTQLIERSEVSDDAMATDNREAAASGEKLKKTPKLKGIRHSGIKLLR
ncbi:COP9 signalosome complex subunit 7b isoform X2 [Aethina tumida]|uniref:COP9 signalosome complex subunit 7b isoform X2 n=1 Tax=Aethina tumida TaxID=116153 RepID=UPI00096AFD4B|nr:COP9 signalosome complex subunit 7b isoform X2 [Aethina tumida]